jgi:hypothetical protein
MLYSGKNGFPSQNFPRRLHLGKWGEYPIPNLRSRPVVLFQKNCGGLKNDLQMAGDGKN